MEEILRDFERWRRERCVVPEPEGFRAIGRESNLKGADRLTQTNLDEIIKAARKSRPR